MSAHTLTPSVVPEVSDTVYLVLDDFGYVLGRAWVETDEKESDLETIIDNLLTNQYTAPVRVAAFNLSEGWARDVSREVAQELLDRARLERRELADAVRDFVEIHTGEDATEPT